MDSATPLIEALAWTLIHFLWEGTVLAAVLWLVLRGMRQASSVWRYAAAALVMAAMLVAAAATLVWQWPAVSDRAASRPAGGIPAWVAAPKTKGTVEITPTPLAGAPWDGAVRPNEPSSPASMARSRPTASTGLAIRPWLPWIVGGWAAGVLAVLGRLAHGWWWLRRVRLGALGVGTGRWNERLREIARALRVDRPVRLLSSVTARVPMVVGWLKPVVIVPAALFAGMPAAQLEAILAHELAHIRRNDFLVNLLQCLVEALLFYHPAVWWVSGQVRKEREHCCDDIAASLCGGALPYARALTALEEFRGEEPVLGLAASGGLLVQRIRRLLGVRDEGTAGWPVVVAVLTLALLPLGMVLGGAKPAFVAPQAAHIGDGVWSSYCVHAGGETQFVFLTKGDFSSSTRSHHNPVARTWKDEGTLRFPDGREVSFRRSSETPDTLVVEDSQPTARFQWEAAAPTSPILGAVEGSGFHSRLVMPLPLLGLGQEEVKVEKNRISYTLSLTKGRVLLLDEVPAGLHLLNVPVKPITSAESLAAARSLVESASAAKATAHPGIWVFPGGVTLRLYGEVVHATDVMTTALITWPGREGQGPAQWHTGIAGDAFANREKWAVGWEKDTPVLWVASRSLGSAEQAPDGRPVANRYKRIDFSDPSHIREDSFQEGWPEADGPSASVVTQLSAFLEVRAGGKSASTLHSWASAGTAERIDLSAVQNILITTAEDETISVEVQELKRTCRPEALAETLAALRAEWTAKRGASLARKSMIPRVTVSVPSGAAPAALEAIRAACVEAGCGPVTTPVTGFGIRLVSEEAGPTTERLPEKAASGGTDTFRHVEKDIVISTVDVASAAAEAPSAGRTAWSILVELTPAAGQRFEEFTGRHLGRRLAIVVDGVVLMSPTVRARIGRSIAISGNFTEAEAKRVAQAIQPTQEGKPGSAPGPAPSKADAPESDGPAHRLKVMESQGLYPLRHFRVLAGVPSGVSSEFEKTHGVEVIIWQPHTLREGTNGELLWPLERSYEKMALRVEADGFVPQVFSWLEKANGAQEWTFQLVDDAGVRGTVMTPENRRPAHDATVVLAMIGRGARLTGTTFPELQIISNPASPREAWERPVVVTPDANGAFTLPTEIDPTAMVLFLHGDGVLEMPYAAWKAQPNVTLQPWGRLHGRVKWGDTAGAGEKVALSAHHGDLYGYPDILSQSDETMASEDGVFVFQRVLPGLCQLSCPIIPKPGNTAGFTAINLDGRLTHTTVASGPTITPVVIGGVGRSVTGRLSGRASYDGITLHLHPTAPHIGLPGDDQIWKAWNAFQASREGRLFFREGLKVAADGRFDIPAVLPGSYQMFFAAPGGEAVVASSNIIVPPEQRDHAPEPMDLGEIKARP